MRFISSLLTGTLVACGPSASDYDDAGPGGGNARDGGPGSQEFVDAAPQEACDKMDIVFVIDDSGSMAEEQDNLRANFPMFIGVLDNYVSEGGKPLDYRVGVTTTGRDIMYNIALPGFPPVPFSESGANGELLMDASCGMNRRWIERADPNVAQTFSCVADVGTGGPSIEMPLLAVNWAFDRRVTDGTNAGFLRDDALLALVILTDEDDCSREDNNFTLDTGDGCDPPGPQIVPLDHYLGFLDTLKDERGRWAAAVIAGPGPGTCTSTFGEAFEAKRLKQFVALTGQNAVFSSICDGDLSSALQSALETFDAACQSFPPIGREVPSH